MLSSFCVLCCIILVTKVSLYDLFWPQQHIFLFGVLRKSSIHLSNHNCWDSQGSLGWNRVSRTCVLALSDAANPRAFWSDPFKVCSLGKQDDGESNPVCCLTLQRKLQLPGLGQAESRSQELAWSSLGAIQAQHSAVLCLLRYIGREELDLNQLLNMGCHWLLTDPWINLLAWRFPVKSSWCKFQH